MCNYKGLMLSSIMSSSDNERKTKLLDHLKVAHTPSDNYGKNGHRFNSQHINSIGGNIIMLPLECIADYVNLESKTLIDNNDEESIKAVKSFTNNKDLFYYFQRMQPEILGYLAYSIISKPENKELVYCATEGLNMYHDYYFFQIARDRESINKMIKDYEQKLQNIN